MTRGSTIVTQSRPKPAKIFNNLGSLVWQDQVNFKGQEKDFRFDTSLVGFGSQETMVMDAARKIRENCSKERKKVLCREMEEILRDRKVKAEIHGDADLGHARVIQIQEEAIRILNTSNWNNMKNLYSLLVFIFLHTLCVECLLSILRGFVCLSRILSL